MEIKEITKSEIHVIQALWEKLNEVHLHDSIHFKEHFKTFTFEKRCKDLISKNSTNIKIDVLYNAKIPVGYCISTIEDETGEIESLFVEEEFRKLGYGYKLVEQGILWLETNRCEKIEVSVTAGHESVFSFYKRFGFQPRMISLCRKKTNTEYNNE
jgi:GNAT superfamily N-acetyltransferase